MRSVAKDWLEPLKAPAIACMTGTSEEAVKIVQLGGLLMIIPSLETDINTTGIHFGSDANDLYVLQKCTTWLHRHIQRYPCFDTESFKFMCWILGENMQELGNHLLSLVKGDIRKRLEEDLADAALNPEDYSPEIAKFLRQSPSIDKLTFIHYASRLLNQKWSKRKDLGRSEIEKNISALRKVFDLDDGEAELCTFFFITSAYSYAEQYFITHMECQKFAGQKYLANMLGFSKRELRTVIYGKLKRIGLCEVDKWGISAEDDFLNLIQNPLDENLARKFYRNLPKATVPLDYFLIDDVHKTHLLGLLKSKSDSPTHILLYGPPGTGKTSFAHSLLNHLKVPSYEIVRSEDNTTKHRRAAIMACLNMTNFNKGSVILVDEADNLLNTQNSWFLRGETQDKGWLNQLLDEPGTRMIWITNSIDYTDESVLRRFAFSLPFKGFNRHQRALLWDSILRKNKCKRYFRPTDVKQFATNYDVSPGVIDLSVKKAIERAPSSRTQFLNMVRMPLESYKTLVNSGDKPTDKNAIEENYALEGLNIDGDIEATIGQIEAFSEYLRNGAHDHTAHMNLLFYGPSGTGKSELARHIAHRVDRKIICKRISDLQSMYVGEGEKNIKRAFEEAESEEAVLIIDEADSLLLSRDRARHSWEISFTNEFLTQMERFRGILVCTTNRLDDLDRASLRRFNHKIGFDYLTAEGNLLFYGLFLESLSSDKLDPISRKELKRIKNLAPGDFKLIRDRYSFHPKKDIKNAVLIDALRYETKLKADLSPNKRIGF